MLANEILLYEAVARCNITNGWLQTEIWQVEKQQKIRMILYILLLLQATVDGFGTP
jgi:hypothetical protein